MKFPELDSAIQKIIANTIVDCEGEPDPLEVDACATCIERLVCDNIPALQESIEHRSETAERVKSLPRKSR